MFDQDSGSPDWLYWEGPSVWLYMDVCVWKQWSFPAEISVKEMKFHPTEQIISHTEFISDETEVFQLCSCEKKVKSELLSFTSEPQTEKSN